MRRRAGVRIIVLVFFAVVMSVLWLGGYVASMSYFNRFDLASDLPGFINDALMMSGPALCAAALAWWVATRRVARSSAPVEANRGDLLALVVVSWAAATGACTFLTHLTSPDPQNLILVSTVIVAGAMILAAFALRRWAGLRTGERSNARAGAVCGALAALLTATFLIVANFLFYLGVAALTSTPHASLGVYMMVWIILGTPLGWYGVPITTAIGALYGALVHRTLTSVDDAPLSRLTDVTLAP